MKSAARILAAFALATGLAVALAAQDITIYTEDNAPAQFKDADGKLAGYAVELVQELQKRIGNKTEIQLVPWARGLAELDTRPNVALFSTARNADRNPKYQWVGPLGESTYAFFTKADSKLVIGSLEDAKKVDKVGVLNNDVRDQYLTKAGLTNLDRSSDYPTILKKLMAGRISIANSSIQAIESQLKQAGFTLADVKQQFIFMRAQTWLAFSKATPAATVKAWQDAFDTMKKDGTIDKVFKKANLPVPGDPITVFN